jgi:hypothetical protein
MWVSRRNTWDISAALSRIKREWYVFIMIWYNFLTNAQHGRLTEVLFGDEALRWRPHQHEPEAGAAKHCRESKERLQEHQSALFQALLEPLQSLNSQTIIQKTP